MTNLTDIKLNEQVQAERMFAACVLVSPDYAIDECGWVRPEDFQDERCGKFWGDLLSGADPIQASFDAGLQPDILDWSNQVVTSLAAPQYAEQVYNRRYLSYVSQDLTIAAQQISQGDVIGLRSTIEIIANRQSGVRRKIMGAEATAAKFAEVIYNPRRNLLTGLRPLDEATAGLELQTMSIVGGRPSMGKSAVGLSIAANIASGLDERVIFFSLEASEISMWARLVCKLAGTTWLDIRKGIVSETVLASLVEKSNTLAASYGDRLIIDENGNHDTESIWRLAAETKPSLIIVDHIALLNDEDATETLRLGKITRRLKLMAKTLNAHVMGLAQLSRKVEDRKDKRPTLADLRDSGEIEQNADYVWLLYRDEYYHPNTTLDKGIMEIYLAKFRDGGRNKVIKCRYDERTQELTPLSMIDINEYSAQKWAAKDVSS